MTRKEIGQETAQAFAGGVDTMKEAEYIGAELFDHSVLISVSAFAKRRIAYLQKSGRKGKMQ